MDISELVMQDHLKGKKHIRLAETQQRQQQQSERSIYVRGFHDGTPVDVIRKYFAKYGSVKNAFVDIHAVSGLLL